MAQRLSIRALLTLLSLWLLTHTDARAQTTSFDYPRSASHLLIDYSRTYAKVAHRDRVDRLRLYGAVVADDCAAA